MRGSLGQFSKAVSVAAVGFVLLTEARPASASTTDVQSLGAAQRFVQAFYDWYTPITMKDSPDPGPPERIMAVQTHRQWFSRSLAVALQRDWAAQEKCPNYIVGLDWDPFLNSQDPNLGYRAGIPVRIGNHYRVPVYNPQANIDHPEDPWVFAFVAFHNGQWEFTDFTPRQEPGIPQRSTMQSLALLRAGRVWEAAHPTLDRPCVGD